MPASTSRPTVSGRIAVARTVLACALLPGAALADAPQGRDLSALPLEDLMRLQVVTAASKFEQLISDAPSAVVVLGASDIRDFGWRTLADALATLPGLAVANDRNYSYLGARGFLRPGDYNSRFLLMIDGVRLNDAVYDQALIGTEGMLDMDMVQRIEYVPGPGSAVYGSNALFGVINVVTRDGSGLAGLRAAAAAGSYGERRGRVSYGWHHQNGADLLLAASAFTRRGQDLYFSEFDTPAQGGGIARRLDGDRAQNVLAKGSYGGVTLEAAHVARTKSVPTASFYAVFGAPNRTRDTQTSVTLSWNGRLAPKVALAAQYTWGRADYLGAGYYPDDDGNAVLNIDGAHARWHGASLSATVTSLPGHKIVAGFEAGRDLRRDQFNYDSAPYAVLLDDRRGAGRTALFVEDEVRLPAGFLLNAGVRLDRHSDPDVQRLSPRVALLYKATARDTVKLIHGSAFRVPNAYEMYYTLPGAGGQLANPRLAPERITTHELVVERALAAAGHARLSVFQYEVKDLINQQAVDDGALSDVLVFRNLDRARVHGAEAALEGQFAGARLRTSYAWQRARGTDGAPLADSPRHLAKANLVAPLRWNGARLGSELLCSSARSDERGTAGGYCVTNLTLTVPRVLGADLSLSVFNAFDKRYADIAGPAFRQPTLERQSRTLYAKLGVRF